MKKVKAILGILLSLTMLVSFQGITVSAAGPNTITINSKTSGHTYQAYQVFVGSYSVNTEGKKVLSNVQWGTGVNGTALLTALKGDTTYGTQFTACTSAADAAKVIDGITDAGFADALAKIVSIHLTTTHTDSGTPTGSYVYQIKNLTDGYYFVNEAGFGGTVDNAYTKFMLQVAGDVTVNAKTDKPAITLKVLENNYAGYVNTWNDAADYSITDNVPYRIVSLVPDMSNFQTYYYQITDTLANSLSFNSGSVKVYFVTGSDMYAVETSTAEGAGGAQITSGYTVSPSASGFAVTFDNLKGVSTVTGTGYIVVEYTAALGSSATIGNPGNPNEVYLTYSNNPNNSAAGNNENGQTPKDEVVVYTFNLPVNKTDDKSPAKPLTGATFAIFTDITNANNAVSDPTTLTGALTFVGNLGNYTRSVASAAGAVTTIQSDSNGSYAIKGLDQGTYYLVEIQEPTGYNRLSAPETVTITSAYNSGSRASAYVDGHDPDVVNDQLTGISVNGGSALTVVNHAGAILPITGGVGTIIFTVSGLGLMTLAFVLIFVRKKTITKKAEK